MARVAAVLHQDLASLAEMEVADLLEWEAEARRLAGELGGAGLR